MHTFANVLAAWRGPEDTWTILRTPLRSPQLRHARIWTLSNAFTGAFKKLDTIPQFKATAKLGEFLNQLPA